MDCFLVFASRNERRLFHPEKIPLADFDAVVAQDAVGGRGMEVEIREGEVGEILLALQRRRLARAEGKVMSFASAPSNCAGLNAFT
jgi:hypothetical protein